MYIQYIRYFGLVTLFWSYKSAMRLFIYIIPIINKNNNSALISGPSCLKGQFILVIYVMWYVFDTLINKQQ